MSNLLLMLACSVLMAVVFFVCEGIFKGEVYLLRPIVVLAFGLSCVGSVVYVLFAAHLGIANALGLFDFPIDEAIGFELDLLPKRERIVAWTCFFMGVFEAMAVCCWWPNRDKWKL